jgi:hypothetical protein
VPTEAQYIINGDTNRQTTGRSNQASKATGSDWN